MDNIIKKVAWLNGQGVEGLGNTAFMKHSSAPFPGMKMINYVTESNLKYFNSNNFKVDEFDTIKTLDFYDHLKDYETVIVNSFPTKKYTMNEINHFYEQLERLSNNGCKIVLIFLFNTPNAYNSLINNVLGMNIADRIYTYNPNAAYWDKYHKVLPHKKDAFKPIFHNYNWQPNLSIENRVPRMVYAGRYAPWKNPEGIFEFFWFDKTMSYDMIGIGRTIETVTNLIKNPKYVGDLNSLHDKKNQYIEHGKVNMFSFTPNEFIKERLRTSMFAYSGFKLNALNYGNRFEFAMLEMIEAGCVCIFNEHFLKNVYAEGKSLYEWDSFLSFNGENAAEIVDKMNLIKNDKVLHQNIINKQLEVAQKITPTHGLIDLMSEIEKDKNTLSSAELKKTFSATQHDNPNIIWHPGDIISCKLFEYDPSQKKIKKGNQTTKPTPKRVNIKKLF